MKNFTNASVLSEKLSDYAQNQQYNSNFSYKQHRMYAICTIQSVVQRNMAMGRRKNIFYMLHISHLHKMEKADKLLKIYNEDTKLELSDDAFKLILKIFGFDLDLMQT